MDAARLERDVCEQMEAGKVPGLALAIFDDREMRYAKGFGVTSLDEGGVPVTPHTLFRIGSTTKPLTGTAVMRLVERGLLDLDRPIAAYVPELLITLPTSARITMRMLLSHSAGLAHSEALCIAEPGRVFSYSNPSLDLASYVAEAVSGTAYLELMRELLFAPLGMHRTTFDPLVALTYPVALGHELLADGSVRAEHRFAENTAQYPSAFALSTVLDLAAFGQLHLAGGAFAGAQLLSSETVAEMQQRQVEFYTPAGDGYGLAFVTERYKGLRRVKHGGMIGSYGSLFVLAPERRLGFAALYNLTDLLSLNDLEAYLFDTLLTPPDDAPALTPFEPDRSRWEQYVGAYRNGEQAAHVAIEGTSLSIRLGDTSLPLVAYRQECYANQEHGLSVGFVAEPAGPVRYLVVDGELYVRA